MGFLNILTLSPIFEELKDLQITCGKNTNKVALPPSYSKLYEQAQSFFGKVIGFFGEALRSLKFVFILPTIH